VIFSDAGALALATAAASEILGPEARALRYACDIFGPTSSRS
jgi:hypothetical protein